MDTIPIRRSIHHDGRRFYATGKTGRRFDNGHAVSEYRHRDEGIDLRLWLDHQDGTIYED